jgi:hypothetical protein
MPSGQRAGAGDRGRGQEALSELPFLCMRSCTMARARGRGDGGRWSPQPGIRTTPTAAGAGVWKHYMTLVSR